MRNLLHGPAWLGVYAVWLCAAASPARGATHQYTESFSSTAYRDAPNTTALWDTGTGQLKMPPFALSLAGSHGTPGQARDVVVAGDLAFVAQSGLGLQILSIADPAAPVPVGSYDTPGFAYGVAVDGDYAFIADDIAGLQILSITNPAAPALLGTYNTSGNALNVAVEGDLALVADSVGLQFINIANPASPQLLSTAYPSAGVVYDVAIAGDLALVAIGATGVQAYDITNPASPVFKGQYNTPGTAYRIAFDGDLAFVGDGAAGLQIVSFANPIAPTLVGTYDTAGFAAGVEVDGDFIYVADSTNGVLALNIQNPASPTLAGAYDTPNEAFNLAVAGERLYVADFNSGMQVLRIALALTGPSIIGSHATPSNAYDVAVDGNLAFVAADAAGVWILDITNPTAPSLVGFYDTPGNARGIDVAGDLLFVADYGSGLQILSVANPASPTLVAARATAGFASDVAVAGNLAVVGTTTTLEVYDITTPASATRIASVPQGGIEVLGVAVAGDLAFLADGSLGLRIYNLATPSAPSPLGILFPGSYTQGIAVAGDLAFITSFSLGLHIVSVANPASPVLVGTCSTGGQALRVAVAGDLAFVATTDAGLKCINVADPMNPTVIGTCDTPGFARGVAVAGDVAYVADSAGGLKSVQVLQREVADVASKQGQSLAVDATVDPIRLARLSSTQAFGVTWELSANGGISWQALTPGSGWNSVVVPGSDLRWRSTHTWSPPGGNPTVSDLQLDWLYEYAAIDAITDIPNDQGRQVRLEWTRSAHDFVGDGLQIVEYAVYRKIDRNLGVAKSGTPAPSPSPSLEGLSAAARENALQMLAAGWDFVTTVPVLVDDSYAVVVPTLADSTIASGPYLTTFRITALTATPGVFFHSPADSGYSVDNLAPAPPSNLALAYNTGGGNTLDWDDPVDADFQYFRVYRSTNPDFTPSPATLVHATATPTWVDPGYTSGGVYYRISAVDFAGNESAFTSASVITAAEPVPTALPRQFALHANQPNPFNPSTVITYDVPAGGGAVSLRVYDAGGRLVRTLVEGPQSAGRRSAQWDGLDGAGRPSASGVYFYRLAAPGYARTRAMVLLK